MDTTNSSAPEYVAVHTVTDAFRMSGMKYVDPKNLLPLLWGLGVSQAKLSCAGTMSLFVKLAIRLMKPLCCLMMLYVPFATVITVIARSWYLNHKVGLQHGQP